MQLACQLASWWFKLNAYEGGRRTRLAPLPLQHRTCPPWPWVRLLITTFRDRQAVVTNRLCPRCSEKWHRLALLRLVSCGSRFIRVVLMVIVVLARTSSSFPGMSTTQTNGLACPAWSEPSDTLGTAA